MAQVLFNLNTCLAVVSWLKKVEGTEGVGITVKYKYDNSESITEMHVKRS